MFNVDELTQIEAISTLLILSIYILLLYCLCIILNIKEKILDE